MTTIPPALLPCPFCGEQPQVLSHTFHECWCKTEGCAMSYKQVGWARWNRRAASPAAPEYPPDDGPLSPEAVAAIRAAAPAQTPAPPQKDLLGSSGTAVDRAAGSQCPTTVAEQKNVWHPPFQRALTVFMLPDGGRASAEADVAAVARGDNTIVKISPGENYFNALRLAAEKDHTLYDKIVVWAKAEDGRFREVGLRAEDELRWPPGFCQEGWEMEVAIGKLRRGRT